MPSPSAWMPLFVGDYLRDTQHLTRGESGAYLHLIMAYWANGGPLSDDPLRLATICKASPEEWSTSVERALRPFFQIPGDGLWHHKRVDLELERANRNIEQKKRAGAASAASRINGRTNSRSTDVGQPLARNGQRNGNPPPPPPPPPPSSPPPPTANAGEVSPAPPLPFSPENSPVRKPKATSILPPGFLAFWAEWPAHSRKAQRTLCAQVWVARGCEEIAEEICRKVRLFKQTADWKKDGGQFIPKPLSWLRGESWEAPVDKALVAAKDAENDAMFKSWGVNV